MSMNREQMMRYLDDPTLLNEKSLGELKEILEEFPFFQTAHMLYARNLLNEKSFRFTNQLKVVAASVTDRSMLYFLLNPKAKRQTSLHEDKTVDLQQAATVPLVSEKAEEEPQDSRIFELTDDTRHTQTVQESPSDHTLETAEEEEISTESTFDLLDFDLMDPSFYQLDEDINTLQGLSELSKSINHNAKKSSQPQEEEQNEQASKDNLIDKFLESKPKLSPSRNRQPLQEDFSERSAEDTDEFMTETLAHIYVKQGYYEKAIKAFQKLSLKYPEKSVYFARQIEEVRKLLNR